MPPGGADLQAEITKLLAAAAQTEIDHAEATRLAAQAHQTEVDDLVETSLRLAAVHASQDRQRDEEHVAEIEHLDRALQSRDLIGRAKGVLIVSMRCTDDYAFAVMVKQSQHENRKLVEIAAEIVERAERRAVPHRNA